MEVDVTPSTSLFICQISSSVSVCSFLTEKSAVGVSYLSGEHFKFTVLHLLLHVVYLLSHIFRNRRPQLVETDHAISHGTVVAERLVARRSELPIDDLSRKSK